MSNDDANRTFPEDVYEKGFFSEFEAPSYEQWYEQAVASLKGAPFEKLVITKTYEDIDLKPMYWPDDLEKVLHKGSFPGQPSFARGSEAGGYVTRPWEICQEASGPSPKDANDSARYGLERGQNAVFIQPDRPSRLGLDVTDAPAAEFGRCGVSMCSLNDVKEVLDGIDLSKTGLYLYCGASALPFVALLAEWLDGQGKSADHLKGCLGADPLGELALEGALPMSLDAAYDAMASVALWAKDNAPFLRTTLVRGASYHDAGCSATQELAFALATGVAYIRAMTERGLDLKDICRSIQFSFSVGSHFFMEIAKLRAARILWSQITDAFGGDDQAQKMRIHARTSSYTKTVYDPNVNMIRNTSEAFSAVLGGADSITVGAFDEPIGPSDTFSRNVSRNLQLLLQQEAHFTHPVDPAGGSWFIESLTESVAQKAWALFQETESKGGMLKALIEGFPQKTAAGVQGKRDFNLSVRKNVLVGTNMYANLLEPVPQPRPIDYDGIRSDRIKALEAQIAAVDKAALDDALNLVQKEIEKRSAKAVVEAVRSVKAGATLGGISGVLKAAGGSEVAVEPLKIQRASASFENLRRNAEKFLAEKGHRPKVFLANMGPIPQHKARADFSMGFFQVGGFDVIGNDGFDSIEAAKKAAFESGAPVVVICSTDKAYPDIVPELTRSIKQDRPDMKVILAGKPAAEFEGAYKDAGLDDYIFIRSNCLEMLERFQKDCGVSHE